MHIDNFESNKKLFLSFLDKASSISDKIENIGLDSRRLKSNIHNAREELIRGEFRVGIIGRFRIGKSTFLNVFLGRRCLKEREVGGGCTAVITKVRSGKQTGAMVYYQTCDAMYDLFISTFRDAGILPDLYQVVIDEVPTTDRLNNADFREKNRNILLLEKSKIQQGFTRKKSLIDFALYILEHWESFKGELGTVKEVSQKKYLDISTDRTMAPFIKEIQLTVDYHNALPDNVVLMDTPGLGAPNWDEAITVKHLKECHAAVHMLLPPAGFEAIDLNLLTDLKKQQPHILDKTVFVVNRSDDISMGAKEEIRTYIEEELGKIGFSGLPILFTCSKLPFLIQVKENNEELSKDEKEYIDFASYRFRIAPKKKSVKKEVMDACGFTELQSVLNGLFESGRAESLLQQGADSIDIICQEIEAVISSQKIMIESGGEGKSKLLEQVDELMNMIDYEKDRLDREIYQATYALKSKVFSWLAPYRKNIEPSTSLWSSLLGRFENPGKYKVSTKKEIVPNELNLKFLGFPVKLPGFKEKIDIAAASIGDYIQEFWSWENYDEYKKSKAGPNAIEETMDKMRDEFLRTLSAKVEAMLVPIIEEVKNDTSSLYNAALEKSRAEVTGVSEALIQKLNKILKTSFQLTEVKEFASSVKDLGDAHTHLKSLGRENGVWEKVVTSAYTVFVNTYKDKIKKKEMMRLGRIRKDLSEHLDRELFFPLIKQLADYIARVAKDLRDVMMVEVEMQLEEVKSYALVDRFGNSQEQINSSIERAVRRQADIRDLESSYESDLLPFRAEINKWNTKKHISKKAVI